MACDAVNFGGRTPDHPCIGGWFDVCGWDDYSSVRRTLLLEHNGLVRVLNAYNKLIGRKTKAKRWPSGSIGWDTPTTAAYTVYEESLEILEKYPDGFLGVVIDFNLAGYEGPIVAMMKMAMADHAAACDIQDALVAAGEAVPQGPEAPPAEKTIAQEFLQFAKDTTKALGLFAVGGVLAILGYNYATQKKGNRW